MINLYQLCKNIEVAPKINMPKCQHTRTDLGYPKRET